jgi:hypothetical protein
VVSKKIHPGCDGGFRRPTMYFETVDWATSNPSISNSPWIRDAPQSGFSLLIRRISKSTINSLLDSDFSLAATVLAHAQEIN